VTLQTQHIPGSKPEPGLRLSFEEFLDTEFDHRRYEWVEGEAVETAPVEDVHALVHSFLFPLLSFYVEAKDGGVVLAEPWCMRTQPDLPLRSPDLQVILKANLSRMKRRQYTEGPADVVIEVVSAGSRTTDRRRKYQEYAKGGVPEYWLIDPLRKQAEFYLLDNGRYVPAVLEEPSGRFASKVLPGFFLDVEWLWNRPSKRELLKLLGVD
jgi:Uma2 family endonuclease